MRSAAFGLSLPGCKKVLIRSTSAFVLNAYIYLFRRVWCWTFVIPRLRLLLLRLTKHATSGTAEPPCRRSDHSRDLPDCCNLNGYVLVVLWALYPARQL